ncbi:MAG: septum formation initiator family protein [Neisseriaceae bacterium]
MKLITGILVVSIVLLQYAIWVDRSGGWRNFSSVEENLALVEQSNRALQVRNNALRAELEDLKHGSQAITETSRRELGFIQSGEVYYQIIP